jgi:uncharacterized RDD family membrane protein YckC
LAQAPTLAAIGPRTYSPAYAGFWLRFAAYLIDNILVFVVWSVLATAVVLMDPGDLRAFLNIAPVGWALAWAYFALCESSPLRGTVGKHALGLYVGDVHGDPISFGRASARYWLKILSSVILMVGWIMAAFTPRKQALHDVLARTLVLRTVTAPAPISAAAAANLHDYWDGRRGQRILGAGRTVNMAIPLPMPARAAPAAGCARPSSCLAGMALLAFIAMLCLSAFFSRTAACPVARVAVIVAAEEIQAREPITASMLTVTEMPRVGSTTARIRRRCPT